MMSGNVHDCNVRFLPIASMIGPDNIEPSGVAAEWILAARNRTNISEI